MPKRPDGRSDAPADYGPPGGTPADLRKYIALFLVMLMVPVAIFIVGGFLLLRLYESLSTLRQQLM